MDATAVLDRFLTGMSDRFHVQKAGPSSSAPPSCRLTGPAERRPTSSACSCAICREGRLPFAQLRERRFALAQELADFMHASGVETYSISDHDTLSAYGAFQPAPGRACSRHRDQHVVPRQRSARSRYGSALLSDAASERCWRTIGRNGASARSAWWINCGGRIRHHPGRRRGRRPNAKALGGRTSARRSSVRASPRHRVGVSKFPEAWKTRYVPSTHVTPHEAIETIGAAGGIAVLAHPVASRTRPSSTSSPARAARSGSVLSAHDAARCATSVRRRRSSGSW